MGSTDRVQVRGKDLFHVATKFFHVNFMPLFPSSSYVVIDFLGQGNRCIEIPLSCKSIFIAWLRFLSWVAVFFLGVFVLAAAGDDVSWELVTFFVMALAIAFFVTWHGSLNDASYDRALELCTEYIKTGTSFDATLKRLVDESFVSQYTSTDELESLSLPSGGMANDSFVQVAVACASGNESGEEVEMLSAVDSMRTDNMFTGNHPTQLPSAETAANNPKQDGNECPTTGTADLHERPIHIV